MLPKLSPQTDEQKRAALIRKYKRREAEIGGKLFGPIPGGRRRQFFCLDKHTWVWHEEWTTQNGQHQAVTTRYNVRPSGILKIQDNQAYQPLSREETRNLYHATQLYKQKVTAYYQSLLQAA